MFSYTASEIGSIVRYHRYGIEYWVNTEKGWQRIIPLKVVED